MLAYPAILRSFNTQCFAASRYGHRTKMSPNDLHAPINEPQYYVINPANPRGAFNDGVEHWLHVPGRPAYDSKHLGGRRLNPQGLAQFCITRLDLLEQSHFLNGDNGLRGEGFKKFDLFLRKRSDFISPDVDCANGHPFTNERRYQTRSGSCADAVLLSPGKLVFTCAEILDVNGSIVDDGAPRQRRSVNRWQFLSFDSSFTEAFRHWSSSAMSRYHSQYVVIPAPDEGIF